MDPGDLIERCCPLCNSKDYLAYKRLINYDTVTSKAIKEKHIAICKDCGFIFQNPCLKRDYLNRLYKGTEDKIVYDSDNLNIQINKHAAEKILHLNAIKRKGSILEIGCSDGYFLKLAKKFGYTVTGIDPSPLHEKVVKKMVSDIRIFNDFFESYKDRDKYDVIIHNFILEHVYDPLAFLRKCRRLINDDGIMLFEVPDVARFKDLPFAIDLFPYQHISHFTRDTIKQILLKSDWKVGAINGGAGLSLRSYGMCVLAFPSEVQSKCSSNTYYDSKKKLDGYFDSLEVQKKRVARTINEIIGKASDKNKCIGIMGTGENCRFIIENTDILKRCKVFFFDSNPALWGKRFYNSIINSPLRITSFGLSAIILASIDYQDDMASYLLSLGVKKSLLKYMYKK